MSQLLNLPYALPIAYRLKVTRIYPSVTLLKLSQFEKRLFFTLNKDPKKVSPKMDYPKFRAAEVITSFLLEDCAQVALQYFWFEESFESHEFVPTDCE